MIQENITITNPSGLNLKPAEILSGRARQYTCKITMYYKHYNINVKSMIHILSAAIPYGTNLILECDGIDEEKCMHDLCTLLTYGLE